MYLVRFVQLKTNPRGRTAEAPRGLMYMFVYVEKCFVLFIPSGDDNDADS